MKKRILSIILSLVLCMGILPLTPLKVSAATATSVPYIDANGVEQICSSATVVENANSKVDWGDGWYVVNSNVTISDTSTVSHLAVNIKGDVHLILADGCTLTVKGHVYGESYSLTIYGQSSGTGKLDVTTTTDNAPSAINFLRGNLTINGGTINATNTLYNTGGGFGIHAENLTINGGTITATAGVPIKSDNAKYYGGTVKTIDSSNSNATETKTYCNVKFDTDGGTAINKVGLEVGGTLSPLPATTKGGYRFDGWFTEKTGGTQITESTQFTENKTIYAHWTQKTVPTATDFNFMPPADLTYNGTKKEATVTSNVAGMGDITVKYYDIANNPVSPAPVNTGTYTVKIDVADGDNFVSATDITANNWNFAVAKATPAYTVPADLTATEGQTLADVTLPVGFTWQDVLATSVGNAGTNTFKATFTPTDTANYNTVTDIDIEIAVKAKSYPVHQHSNLTWVYTDTEHWQTCTHCIERVAYWVHDYTADNPDVCRLCGYTKVKPTPVPTPQPEPVIGDEEQSEEIVEPTTQPTATPTPAAQPTSTPTPQDTDTSGGLTGTNLLLIGGIGALTFIFILWAIFKKKNKE